jgi:hypothetical protein
MTTEEVRRRTSPFGKPRCDDDGRVEKWKDVEKETED